MREERDSLGVVLVPNNRYWGAQTERARNNFPIGVPEERMPKEVIQAIALVKKAAAIVHHDLGMFTEEKRNGIVQAADEVMQGALDDEFPLPIWQTGSGTQTNMNLNEVIANRAIELLGGVVGSKQPVHPNDDVNRSQSSNDVFPTAMHIAAYKAIQERLFPSLRALTTLFMAKAKQYEKLVKIGRTHLMDATPITFGQELSAYGTQLHEATSFLESAIASLLPLAIGGTAVGTGLNAPKEFGQRMAAKIGELTGMPFTQATNRFSLLAAHDAISRVSSALKVLATALFKIANDLRWLASGPRCGIGELFLPANEPGSSIMPGKVNPTQCEMMTQICLLVLGNDVSIAMANTQGQLQLNVFKPLLIFQLLQSIRLLSDGMESFRKRCIDGLIPNEKKMRYHLDHSLMLVTALNREIGYDNACKIAQFAHQEDLSLEEAAVKLGLLSRERFIALVNPDQMV